MLQKNKYWKSLLGTNAEVIVAKNVAYTTDATYALFVANAVEGEVGIFNADTFALFDGLATAGATINLFAAIKRDGIVEKTTVFSVGGSKSTRSAYAAGVAQVSDADLAGVPVAGKEYGVKIIETTPGFQQFPSWDYSVVAKTGETLVQLVTRIIALVNDTTNVINKDTDPIVTAAINAVDNIRFTANVAGTSFRIAFSADIIADLAAKATYVTPPSYGSGVASMVAELEKIGFIHAGVTTNYPEQGANPSDFGSPTPFASSALNYHLYVINTSASEESPTPKALTFHKRTIVLAIPTAGGPEVQVKLILGL